MTNSTERASPVRAGYVVYQQVAAVMAALALAAMLGDLFVDWRSGLASLVGQWNEYVRPAVAWLLHVVLELPVFLVFRWHMHVPVLIRDYLSVGIILMMSFIRAARIKQINILGMVAILALDEEEMESLWAKILWFTICVTFWPMIAGIVAIALTGSIFLSVVPQGGVTSPGNAVTSPEELLGSLVVLSPLIYLTSLLLVNYFLL